MAVKTYFEATLYIKTRDNDHEYKYTNQMEEADITNEEGYIADLKHQFRHYINYTIMCAALPKENEDGDEILISYLIKGEAPFIFTVNADFGLLMSEIDELEYPFEVSDES